MDITFSILYVINYETFVSVILTFETSIDSLTLFFIIYHLLLLSEEKTPFAYMIFADNSLAQK